MQLGGKFEIIFNSAVSKALQSGILEPRQDLF
jgi:hypothetical protein